MKRWCTFCKITFFFVILHVLVGNLKAMVPGEPTPAATMPGAPSPPEAKMPGVPGPGMPPSPKKMPEAPAMPGAPSPEKIPSPGALPEPGPPSPPKLPAPEKLPTAMPGMPGMAPPPAKKPSPEIPGVAAPPMPGVPAPGVPSPAAPPPAPPMPGAPMPGVPPPSPAPLEPAAAPETVDFPEEYVGFQGNWVKKKDWITRAYELQNQIRTLVLQIQEIRSSFNDKYNAIDNELDDFYRSLGLDQGKLQQLFASVLKYLDKKKKEEIKAIEDKEEQRIKERERAIKIELIEEKIKDYKTKLDQLKLDMKSIEDLDKSVNDRLKKLNDQIKQANKLNQEATDVINKMWNVIDHRKTQQMYFQLKGDIFEKIKGIQTYLSSTLTQDLDKVISSIRSQMGKTKDEIEELERKGIIIKGRSKRLEELKIEQIRKIEEAKKLEEAKPRPIRIKKKPKTWYDTFVDWSARFIDFFKSIYQSIFGPKPVVKKRPQPKQPEVMPGKQSVAEPMPMPSPGSGMTPRPTPAPPMIPGMPEPSIPGGSPMVLPQGPQMPGPNAPLPPMPMEKEG